MAERAHKKRKMDSSSGPTITDPRFANIQNDPRYRLPSKKERVKLDERFSRKLQHDDWSRKAKVDRYGRKPKTDSEKTRLKRKYEIEGESEGDDGNEESDNPDDDEEVQRELKRAQDANKTRDILRQGRETDSSSSSESSSEEEETEDEFEEEAELAPQTKDDVPTGEVSSRLAVVNLDWDNIRAEDLMAVFKSFLQSDGRLLKVAVYPSEFGKERMEREEMEGPPKEIFAAANAEDRESEDDDDDEAIKKELLKPDDGTTDFDSQALRQYQLDRLRYFYAVLTFSSPQAAKAIYDAVDGTEYQSTANFFDLRFIPDETDFSDDAPRDECERVGTNYQPTEFITDALQHSKVKLTWDAEDTNRKEAAARAFRTHDIKDLDDVDLAAYIGSDSSDGESEQEDADANFDHPAAKTNKDDSRQKMRSLLGLAAEPSKKSNGSKTKERAPVGSVEITFSAGLTSNGTGDDASKKRSVFENSPEPDETTVEKYIRKEKERKARRREKAKAARAGITEPVTKSGAETPADSPNPDLPNNDNNDAGFDDAFFAEPSAVDASNQKNKLRKEERLQKRREREAEAERDRKEREQLEQLMADENEKSSSGNKKGGGMRHFDMREVLKAEKRAEKEKRMKGKDKKTMKMGDGKGKSNGADADAFEVDTADPRFQHRLFGSHEFAIDPTNPRYGATKGMAKLMEEGRKRRRGG